MVKLSKTAWVLLFLFVLMPGFFDLSHGKDIQLPRITIEELKNLIDSGADIVVIDTQVKLLYDHGHIKGAISLPVVKEIELEDVAHLPQDKLVVLYCDCGPGEGDSNNMGNQLTGIGFTNIKVLAHPSISGWKEKRYPIEK